MKETGLQPRHACVECGSHTYRETCSTCGSMNLRPVVPGRADIRRARELSLSMHALGRFQRGDAQRDLERV